MQYRKNVIMFLIAQSRSSIKNRAFSNCDDINFVSTLAMGLIVVALLLCQRRRKHSKQSARTGQESLTANNSSLVKKV